MFMYPKIPVFFLCVFVVSVIFAGCGTDAKPSYFTNMLKEPSEVDRLSECLAAQPQINGDTLTIESNIPCLVELSKRDVVGLGEQPIDTDLANILKDPEAYLGKVLMFEATGIEWHHPQLELFTNQVNRACYLNFQNSNFRNKVFTLDNKGEKEKIVPGVAYKWRGIEISSISISAQGLKIVYFEFLTDQTGIIHQPVRVKESVNNE